MYAWEHSDLESTCKRFMDSWHKCKNNKHSNDKKIIEKSPKKVVFVKVEQRKR
tara:strand:- start:11988 stop:12146 length:159 start_codon:yes stop_codon:yes gene_type:complete